MPSGPVVTSMPSVSKFSGWPPRSGAGGGEAPGRRGAARRDVALGGRAGGVMFVSSLGGVGQKHRFLFVGLLAIEAETYGIFSCFVTKRCTILQGVDVLPFPTGLSLRFHFQSSPWIGFNPGHSVLRPPRPGVLEPHWRNCFRSSRLTLSKPARCSSEYWSMHPCPEDSTKRSRFASGARKTPAVK